MAKGIMMRKEIVLTHMQNYVVALKELSRGASVEKTREMYKESTNLITELKSLNEEETKWFEQKYTEWLKQKGLFGLQSNFKPNNNVPSIPVNKLA